MCGISGGFNYFNKKINLRSSIEKIVKLQHLRGPDDNDIWESLDKKVCFGHNRLSIIDLSKNGKQPFVSADKKFIISFNGEIYNYRELKNELIIKGVIFKSDSDTEVLIESYKYWGIDFLNKLRGMFAFAIWDTLNKKLILARDPFGIKPLYYTNKSCFYFASEVKSLLSLKNISLEISNQGLANYYLWGNMQDPFTLYKDIKSLEMGTCLLIDEKGNQNTIKYADFKKTIIESDQLKFKMILKKMNIYQKY
jgi:asparagine synthase (glutamine-hydrolysing)